MRKNRKLNSKKMAVNLERLHKELEYFTEKRLRELERVSKISTDVDGFSAGGGEGGGSKGEISNPTLASVITLLERSRKEPDIRGEAITAVLEHLEEAQRHIRLAKRSAIVFQTVGESERGRQTSIQECRACSYVVGGTETDRLKTGYCPACYTAFRRSTDGRGGRLAHHIFEKQRKAELAAENEEKKIS